ncbi:efflux transporter outer membrane subunit [Shimia sp.]|uniref:efflux transporter outer membrane subunit n=1 Tax=Shimia sp. TaxID=1954381 RepID=UPI003297A3CF
MHRRKFMMMAGAQFGWVAGCSVGEDFVRPSKDVPDQFFTRQNESSGLGNSADWWRAFNDDKLNRLVELGLKQNLDIQRAVARVEQSQAILGAAGYPVSGVSRVGEARASAGGEDGRTESGFVRAEASWQVDLYGKLKREKEAAFYRLEGAYADANVARTTFLSELATAYVDARYFQELIRILRRVVDSREETLAATLKARQAAATGAKPEDGTTLPEVSELDVAQARTLVATARADLPEARILFFKNVSRVGSLLGQAWNQPREGLDRTAPQPVPRTHSLRTGIPADLVRNRPDVTLAENRLAEAVALAGVAKAELYPELHLTGNINIGFSDDAFVPTAGFLRVGLDVPLFDLPERRSKVAFQKARAKELLFAWEREVIEAVEEVQDALVSLNNHEDSVRYTAEAVAQTKEVLRLAREAYVGGGASFLQVLDAERALLSLENALAQDRRNFAVDYVNLSVALGGSFK